MAGARVRAVARPKACSVPGSRRLAGQHDGPGLPRARSARAVGPAPVAGRSRCPRHPARHGRREVEGGLRQDSLMVDVPPYHELLWPTLTAVSELGGSGSIGEIAEAVVKRERFTEDQQAVLHNDGPQTKIEYRLAWARSYLKGMGLLTNSKRGVWTLTDEGTALLTDPDLTDADRRQRLRELLGEHVTQTRKVQKSKQQRPPGDGTPGGGPTGSASDETADWKQTLLEAVMAAPPDKFERLAKRLLREAGFISATVTGRSGDGGIDGLGVYRLSLVSCPVFYQCKRYRGSVSSGAVRDFRGAMAGRGDKGLLITTGSFTAEAKAEATRDGAPPVDLIDGDRLCDLLKEYELGVRTAIRQVEDITVDPSFFAEV